MITALIDRLTGLMRPAAPAAPTAPPPLPVLITPSLLQAMGARHINATKYAPHLNAAAVRYSITTPARVAAWLANLAHESARFSTVVESLNYSAEGLAATWPARYADISGNPTAIARRMHRRPEDIANITYAGRMGNGSAGTGDGWKYRGRGLIQITGRDNYAACGHALGLDLINHPELLEQPDHAAMSAGWYWHKRLLNDLADAGKLESITRLINGGLTGHKDRALLASIAADHLGSA